MKKIGLIIVASLVIFIEAGFSQQVSLIPTTGALNSCNNVNVGTTLSFVRGNSSCDQNVIVVRGGSNGIFTEDDIIEIFPETMNSFSYAFEEEGEFTVYCGYPFSGNAVLGPAVCYNVIPAAPIPTIDEWAIVLLLLSMTIIGVVAARRVKSVQSAL